MAMSGWRSESPRKVENVTSLGKPSLLREGRQQRLTRLRSPNDMIQVMRSCALLIPLFAGCTGGGSGTSGSRIHGTVTLSADNSSFKGSVSVADGAIVTLESGILEVGGDLVIEPNSELAAAGSNDLVLIVEGDLVMAGALASDDDVIVVSSPALLPPVFGDEFTAFNEPPPAVIFDSEQANLDHPDARSWSIRGSLSPGNVGVGSAGWTFVHVIGELDVSADLEAADGVDGNDSASCTINGSSGGRGGSVVLRATGGAITLHDVAITGGNGGDGGSVTATSCAAGDEVVGGRGGIPGSFQVFAEVAEAENAGDGVFVDGIFLVEGFQGGDGGDASIAGLEGASVTAQGGRGNQAEGAALTIVALQNDASLSFTFWNSGHGGTASATAGDGAVSVCDRGSGDATTGGGGGVAVAVGGDGGYVKASGIYSTAAGGNDPEIYALGTGHGGSAFAKGGNGAVGANCTDDAGDGGKGGDVAATAGIATIPDQSLTYFVDVLLIGTDGTVVETGGNGGNGGNSTLGTGGDGGSPGCPGGASGGGGTGVVGGVSAGGC